MLLPAITCALSVLMVAQGFQNAFPSKNFPSRGLGVSSFHAFKSNLHFPTRRVAVRGGGARSVTMSSSEPADCIIMGGGFSGLAMALALKNIAGIDNVPVFERASDEQWRREGCGSAIILAPNGQQALKMISPDLLKKAVELGQPCSQAAWGSRSWDTGLEDQYGHASLAIQWSVLREVLASFLDEKTVTCSAELIGYSTNTECVKANIKTKDGDISVPTKMIVGADGIRSSVRHLMQTKPAQEDGEDKYVLVHENKTPPIEMEWTIVRVVLNRSVPEYADKTWAGRLSNGMAKLSIFPLGGDQAYWAVTLKDPEGKYLTMDREQIKELMIKEVRDDGFDDLADLIEETDTKEYTIGRLPYLPVQKAFTRGRVAVIGDAAHAMQATYGQGASVAFEDAVQLALCLKRHGGDCVAALEEYNTIRTDRAGYIQLESERKGTSVMDGKDSDEAPRFSTQMEFQDWLNVFVPEYKELLPTTA